jgi:hypothetical protein
MNNIEKYTKYFMAQAMGKLPNQRGGSLLTLNKALDWVTKFCDVASQATKVVSPIEMVADRIKNEVFQKDIKEHKGKSITHIPKSSKRKRSHKKHSHRLIKRIKKDD